MTTLLEEAKAQSRFASTLRSGKSYADATRNSNSLSSDSEATCQVIHRSDLPTQEEDVCSLTSDSLLITSISSDSSPVGKLKKMKKKRDKLGSASDSDESHFSSKFARSRGNSEDSPLLSENDTTTDPRNRLFVGGIPLQFRANQIIEIFSQFGKVKHVHVHKTKHGTSKVLLNSLLSHPFHRTITLLYLPHLTTIYHIWQLLTMSYHHNQTQM